MNAATPIPADPDTQLLDELGQLGLALARDLQAAALKAEDADAKAKLASAFHKVARGVRQGVALKEKLARERQAFACEVAPQLARAEDRAAERRRSQLQVGLERVLWDEYDYEKDVHYRELMAEVRRALKQDARLPDFAAEPFDAQLARYRQRFDPATWEFSGDEDKEDRWGLRASRPADSS